MNKAENVFSPDTNHSFNVNMAMCLTVPKAILLKDLKRFSDYKLKNGKDVYNGVAFVYMSGKGFNELYPYLSDKSINRWLNEMQEAGLIASTSALNKKAYDKTKWYCVNYKAYSLLVQGMTPTLSQNEKWTSQIEQCISQIEQSISQNEQPIPPLTSSITPQTDSDFDSEKEFEWFWSTYNYKVGKHETELFWHSLDFPTMQTIREHLPAYLESKKDTPKRYWKKPANYLKEAIYNDEVVTEEPEKEERPRAGFVLPIRRTAEQFKKRAQ